MSAHSKIFFPRLINLLKVVTFSNHGYLIHYVGSGIGCTKRWLLSLLRGLESGTNFDGARDLSAVG